MIDASDDCGVERVMCVNAAESDAILIHITSTPIIRSAHVRVYTVTSVSLSVIVFKRHIRSFISICVH